MRLDHPSLDDRWRARGACVGHPTPDLWFPERKPGSDNQGLAAKAVCRSCPVRTECLTVAVARDEPFGIQGGAGEKAKRVLRQAWVIDGPTEGIRWRRAVAEHFGRLDGKASAQRLNVNGPGARHGRRSTHAHGCRCGWCALAAAVDAQVSRLAA